MANKILFTGYYGFKNFGDDLFGLACVNGLRNSGSDHIPIILSPPVNGVDARYLVPAMLGGLYKSKGVIGKLLRALFMTYGCLRCRDVVLSGGSVISSGGGGNIRFIQYYLAKFGFCRLSAIGVSIGPFFSEKDRAGAKIFMNELSYLCVRDEVSVRECRRLGVDIKVNLYNDLAGCAPLPQTRGPKGSSRTLGVSLCGYESIVGGDIKRESLRNSAVFEGVSEFCIKYGFKVKVLVLNSNELVGDVGVSRAFLDYLSYRNVSAEFVGYEGPVKSLNDISSCEVFFSVRLHGAISAYLLNIPFALVEYHAKCKDFLDYIGFDEDSRISAGVVDKKEVFKCLERVCQEDNVYLIEPKEYIERSNNVFLNAPWMV